MSTDDQCCLCGSRGEDVRFCEICRHRFCFACRRDYFRRGVEAVKQLLGRSKLVCGGQHG